MEVQGCYGDAVQGTIMGMNVNHVAWYTQLEIQSTRNFCLNEKKKNYEL